jgi:hypothetical protein
VSKRPLECRIAIARPFVAKAVYKLLTTAVLLDQLESNTKLRRLCGWEKKNDALSSSSFSRAFAEFSQSQLAERFHTAVVD